jgi:hypothetical protein
MQWLSERTLSVLLPQKSAQRRYDMLEAEAVVRSR